MTLFRKNNTPPVNRDKSDEKGALLIEMIAVLGIMSVMFPMMAKQDSIRRLETDNINIANQTRRIMEATDALVKDKYRNLLQDATLPIDNCGSTGTIAINKLETPANIITLTVADLKNMGYLPCGLEDTNKYGQAYSIAMKAELVPPAANNKYRIDAMVVTTGGQAIPERHAAQIAEFIGAKGGYVSDIFNKVGANVNTSGTGGSWTMDVEADFGVVETAGHLSTFASSYVESADSSVHNPNVLYRNKVDGFPEANTMQVDLDMGGKNITNAGTINAANITAVNATIDHLVVNNSINITDTLTAATITATGAITAKTVTADSGITITATGLTINNGGGDITANDSALTIKSVSAKGDIITTGGVTSNIIASDDGSRIEAGTASATKFVDTSKNPDDTPKLWVFGADAGNAYMADPSGTSLMNDIKLASRGGARLSEILPNYILKDVKYYENVSQYGNKPLFDDAPLFDSTSAYWGDTRFNGQSYSFASTGAQDFDESATYPCPNDFDNTLPYYKDPDTGACGAITPLAPSCGTAWTDDEVTNCLSGPMLTDYKSGPLAGDPQIKFPTCPDHYKPIISVMPVKWDSAAARYCHFGDTAADCVALNLQAGDDPVFMSQDSGRVFVTAKVTSANDGWLLYMGQIYPQPISTQAPAGTYIWNSPDESPTKATVKQREMGAVVNIYCYFDKTVYDDSTAPKIPTP